MIWSLLIYLSITWTYMKIMLIFSLLHICNECCKPTEDAYSSGHLVLSYLGLTCVPMLRPVFLKLIMFKDFKFRIFLVTIILLINIGILLFADIISLNKFLFLRPFSKLLSEIRVISFQVFVSTEVSGLLHHSSVDDEEGERYHTCYFLWFGNIVTHSTVTIWPIDHREDNPFYTWDLSWSIARWQKARLELYDNPQRRHVVDLRSNWFFSQTHSVLRSKQTHLNGCLSIFLYTIFFTSHAC